MPARVLLAFRGEAPGPTLVAVAALHGNEPAGLQALERLGERLRAAGGLRRGAVVGMVGNRRASALGRRYLDRDLNRLWEMSPADAATFREGRERRELTRALAELRRSSPGPLHVVDLHTTSGKGPAFTIVPASPWGRAEADALPVPRITGVFTSLRGTFGGWLDRHRIPNLILEAGAHGDPESVTRAEAVLRILAERLGLAGPRWLDTDEARRVLARGVEGIPPVLQVRHRHPIVPDDEFRMAPGFGNLEWVPEGTLLARDRRGPIVAPFDGWLLLPLYQRLGEEGFLLAEAAGSVGSRTPRGEGAATR
jgi:predicted deacylase